MWRLTRSAVASFRRSRRLSTEIPGPCIVHKSGADILHDPWFNKVRFAFVINFAFLSCPLNRTLDDRIISGII